ncbi:MAG: outer membrane beta-barrel protein [Saprospiraceae bacterium]
MFKYLLSLFALWICLPVYGQSDEIVQHENLVYYNSSIKEYLMYMKENTQDPEILDLINSMEKYNLVLEEKLANVVLPESAEMEEEFIDESMPEEDMEEDIQEDMEQYGMPEEDMQEGMEEDFESFGMNRFMPFKKKFKTSFEIQVGINNIHKNSVSANANDPEIYTPSSWYWEFGLLTKNRLGSKKSKVALSYGLSYLINRFSMDNDLRLDVINNQPEFVEIDNVKNNPKLNIGYLNIPLALDFKLSKGFQCSLGGFVGYRVMTKQKLETKPNFERIEEERFANYKLNNWLYGAKVSLGLKGFNIVGRYCFNNLFRDNDNYDFNTFMIGTSFRI